jgi:hypothetical protein
MTTIFSVVDNTAALPQRDEPRQPAKDFAHELTKQEPPSKQLAQNETKTATDSGFHQQQMAFEPDEFRSVAAMDEPLPKTSLQLAMLEQAAEPITVAPMGVTVTLLEARVFGWHAMAQAYLSELTAADGNVKQYSASQLSESVAAAPAEPVEAPAAAPVLADAAMPQEAAGDQSIEPLSIQPMLTVDDAAPSNAVESTVAGSSAQALWAERSLRFTRQRDGSRVAWIRDFRLSDAEASHLTQWVLSDAKQKGMALSRIMLNGREVWTSPNLKGRDTP